MPIFYLRYCSLNFVRCIVNKSLPKNLNLNQTLYNCARRNSTNCLFWDSTQTYFHENRVINKTKTNKKLSVVDVEFREQDTGYVFNSDLPWSSA